MSLSVPSFDDIQASFHHGTSTAGRAERGGLGYMVASGGNRVNYLPAGMNASVPMPNNRNQHADVSINAGPGILPLQCMKKVSLDSDVIYIEDGMFKRTGLSHRENNAHSIGT